MPDSTTAVHREVTVHHVPNHFGKAPFEFVQTRVDTYSDSNGAKGDSTGPYQLGEEWLTGRGPRHHIFGAGDPMTKLLRKHEHIRALVLDVCKRLRRGEVVSKGTKPYKLDGISGVPLYAKDYSSLATGGLTGNLAVTFLGSYGLDYSVAKLNKAQCTAELRLHVWNRSTVGSATRPPVLGYTLFWKKNIDKQLTGGFQSGPLSLTQHDFYWTEYLDWHEAQCQ